MSLIEFARTIGLCERRKRVRAIRRPNVHRPQNRILYFDKLSQVQVERASLILTNSDLRIGEVTEVNEGLYRVVVRSSYGINPSADVFLTVNHPPSITNALTVLALSAGTNVILQSWAEGNAPIHYQCTFGAAEWGTRKTGCCESTPKSRNETSCAVLETNRVIGHQEPQSAGAE